MIKIYKYLLAVSLPVFFLVSSVSGATKPSSESDPTSLSYVFYLYYDAGQLLGDRDYQVKFDVVNEKYVAVSPMPGDYKIKIFNSRGEAVQTVSFDPKAGNTALASGKVQVKAPYVANGIRASFFDNQDRQLMTIFVTSVALCNDDGFCNVNDGENTNTCPSDCQQARPSGSPTTTPSVIGGGDYEITAVLLYVFSGLAVLVAAWFGWKWWKKRKGENFLPPPPPVAPPPSSAPPMPGM